MASRVPKRAGELLQKWLEENDKTAAWLAEQLGVDRVVLWRWMVGERTPRIEHCAAIERITNSAVPAASWAEAA
jgi:plasmid maintenance system antidote protein VapI